MGQESAAAKLAEIGAALANREFEPVFQPILKLPGRDVLGFEALARWRRPGQGLLPPSAFIEALEDPALESRISEAVAQKVIAAAAFLKSRRLDFGRLAINLGERQLGDSGFADRLLNQARAEGVSPSEISVEVRETVRLDPKRLDAFDGLKRFAAAGVLVALDDFGAGYASLQQLTLPFLKRLKIDLFLTQAAVGDGRARLILKRCFEIGADLDLEVVAEGVEDRRTDAMLTDLGCPAAQGYFYARPGPLAEVVERLENGGYAP